jgi:hypothetical protein
VLGLFLNLFLDGATPGAGSEAMPRRPWRPSELLFYCVLRFFEARLVSRQSIFSTNNFDISFPGEERKSLALLEKEMAEMGTSRRRGVSGG